MLDPDGRVCTGVMVGYSVHLQVTRALRRSTCRCCGRVLVIGARTKALCSPVATSE